MPTVTYEHLSEEKKARLLEAIRREWTRASFDRISINRIVQDAQISRGSFYQYFIDKEDLYALVVQDVIEGWTHLVQANWKQHEDARSWTLGMFDNFCAYGRERWNPSLFRHLFEHMRERMDQCDSHPLQLLMDAYRRDPRLVGSLQVASEDVHAAVEILCDLLCSALAKVWIRRRPEEEVRGQLEQKLRLVCDGIGGKGER